MKREEAQEFSEAFGQIGSGWWRQIAWAQQQGVPKALGLETKEWIERYVGGHVKLTLEKTERQEAVKELSANGMTTREIGDVLGVHHSTAADDLQAVGNPTGESAEAGQIINGEKDVVGNPTEQLITANVQEHAAPKKIAPAKFNQVNDNIGWARWSWNPVTGCKHDCDYCYARDIAERFRGSKGGYPKGFEPDFHEQRLEAPANMKVPTKAVEDPAWRRVFTCSMADLFGQWVPEEWITRVFQAIEDSPQWEYLLLTKFPQRLAELKWPDSVWAGTTVDRQHRVAAAERAFSEVEAGVKWLSCEPLLEPLKFESLEMFDWVVIGASTGSKYVPPFAPPIEWVFDLYAQARTAGCRVYLKHNLFGAKEGHMPGMQPVREWPR